MMGNITFQWTEHAFELGTAGGVFHRFEFASREIY